MVGLPRRSGWYSLGHPQKMMRFRPYPKIPLRPESTPGGNWVATEKIHGANFVIACDGQTVRFGKRKEWLQAETPFFGWQLLAHRLEAQIRALFVSVGAPQLVAYGELFGGGYPHPLVSPIPALSPVQTGVWYTPTLEWAVLDLLLVSGEEEEGEWLSFPDLLSVTSAHGLRTPPLRGRGKRSELESIPVEFQTMIPEQFGLPPLPGNLAEGLVLKPERGGHARPVLKKKIEVFNEARFGEAENWTPEEVGLAGIEYWARQLVNPARIASARSKVGMDPEAVLEEVVLDVGIDLETTFSRGWARIGPEQEAVLARVRSWAADLVGG